jgi:DNA-binding NarL/FixJ family response regulator
MTSALESPTWPPTAVPQRLHREAENQGTDKIRVLARGKSNKEISASLYLSETTVKAHLRSIFAKLNVLSRTEAIATASRRGLVQL